MQMKKIINKKWRKRQHVYYGEGFEEELWIG